jgi:Cdc6-like AAA superfamily ATPase
LEILKKKLKSNEEKAFDYSLYIEIVAEEEKTLKKASGDLRSKMEEAQVDITPLYDRQNEAKAAAAPLGQDVPKSSQVFDTASLATAFPWVERSVVHPEGTLMGIHEGSGEPLVLNQFRFAGHNALITGKIGSGKSYFAKLINMRRLLSDDDVELLIVDPTGGYQDAVNAFNGQVVDFGDPRLTLNPLEVSKPEEMSATQQVNDEILASKIDNTIDLLAASINNGQPFDMVPENVIRQTARLAYLEKGITDSPETHYKEAPTIGDISNILRNIQAGNKPSEFLELPQEMYEAEVRKAEGGDIPLLSDNSRDQASKLYMGLEPFRDGLYSSFNGQSNVDINNRIVQYDISAITQDNNQAIVQHAVLSNIFERAKASKKRTIIVIDEAHYLIQNERTLGMLNLLVRHSRHYNTGLLIISQTVDEFMNSEKAKEIYDQCDIRALMYHSDIGEQAIDALNLTEGQIQYIKTAQQGDEEGTDYSQSLLDIESIGKKRIRIPSFGLEQHIIDEDKSIWAWLYHQGVVEWDEIPNSEQERARELLIRDFGMEIASS